MLLNSIPNCKYLQTIIHRENIEKDNKVPNVAPTGKPYDHPFDNPHNPVNFSGVPFIH